MKINQYTISKELKKEGVQYYFNFKCTIENINFTFKIIKLKDEIVNVFMTNKIKILNALMLNNNAINENNLIHFVINQIKNNFKLEI